MPGPKFCFQQQQRLLIAECWAPISKLLFKILPASGILALPCYMHGAWLGEAALVFFVG